MADGYGTRSGKLGGGIKSTQPRTIVQYFSLKFYATDPCSCSYPLYAKRIDSIVCRGSIKAIKRVSPSKRKLNVLSFRQQWCSFSGEKKRHRSLFVSFAWTGSLSTIEPHSFRRRRVLRLFFVAFPNMQFTVSFCELGVASENSTPCRYRQKRHTNGENYTIHD